MLSLLAALVLVTADPPAPAAPDAATSPASAELKAGEKKVRAVCKDYTPSGTRFAKKRCIEVNAYARQQEIDRQAYEEVQNRPMVEIRRGN